METSTAPAAGILGTLRALADRGLAGLHSRFELLALEAQEEKLRLIQSLVWIGAAFCAALLAVVFASLTVIVYFWETARMAALLGVTATYSILAGGLIVTYRRHQRRQPPPFAASIEALREDRACIPPDNFET